jgi:hypothetical protein
MIRFDDPDGTMLMLGVILTGEGHGGDGGRLDQHHLLKQIHRSTFE